MRRPRAPPIDVQRRISLRFERAAPSQGAPQTAGLGFVVGEIVFRSTARSNDDSVAQIAGAAMYLTLENAGDGARADVWALCMRNVHRGGGRLLHAREVDAREVGRPLTQMRIPLSEVPEAPLISSFGRFFISSTSSTGRTAPA